MDVKYKQITAKLNANYNTSPNIIKLWQKYLEIKKQRFMDDLCKCEQMLQQINNINNINNISMEFLLTLYLMQEYR